MGDDTIIMGFITLGLVWVWGTLTAFLPIFRNSEGGQIYLWLCIMVFAIMTIIETTNGG